MTAAGDPTPVLRDPARLAALLRARVLDTEPEPVFDRLTALASRLLDVPVALVSLVTDDRQFFKSCIGLPQPWATDRETPLSHSFCQYAVGTNAPLVVEDARTDPVLTTNLAIPDLGVVAYAGMPIRSKDGQALGSFCVIDSKPRSWSADELAIVSDLADITGGLLDLRLGDVVAGERRAVLANVVEVQEAERARIAAEVHDDSLQVIAALSIRLQLLQRRLDGESAAAVAALLDTVDVASDKLRRLVFDLRPSVLDHDGLGGALRAYLQHICADRSVEVVVDDDDLPELATPVRLVLFRIAQQAIANALAHSGASRLGVSLRVDGDAGDEVRMEVRDDGCGFDVAVAGPRPGHLGLVTMRERAEVAGGRLEIDSAPGAGTVVRVTLPRSGA